MSYSLAVLQKLSSVLFPGVRLDKGNASRLAAALKQAAEQLADADAVLPDGAAPAADDEGAGNVHRRLKKAKRSFDFSRYQQRFIALNLYYIGWTFHGFASQDHDENTVEGHVFRSLKKVCLIPEDAGWEDVKYSRCGRTDIGVSASDQTIALTVRSASLRDQPLPGVEQELDYTHMLNRVLPDGIRVMAWAPAADDFHARYSAAYREYKYFIAGARSLDVAAMRTAAKMLEGSHDFSNLCRMNLGNSTQHRRTIMHADVSTAPDSDDLAVFTIRGKAFIWNQVRCIAAIILMIGQGLESTSVMELLLDVEKTPGKPQYRMASEFPLLLHRTEFDQELRFTNSAAAAAPLLHGIVQQKNDLTERLALLSAVEARVRARCAHHDADQLRVQPQHVPMVKRGTDPSFAERLTAFQHKRSKTAASSADMSVADQEPS